MKNFEINHKDSNFKIILLKFCLKQYKVRFRVVSNLLIRIERCDIAQSCIIIRSSR